jgi:anthranilate phosphoribosyltransferase
LQPTAEPDKKPTCSLSWYFFCIGCGCRYFLHGTLEGAGRIATAYILRELGVLPVGSLAQAQKSMDDDLLAFVPTAVLCPGLANLLSLRNRLGCEQSGP